MPLLVEDVFVTEGVPRFTFVKPPNYNEILLDIRHPGKPVIVEGQSGTGKTTCVRKVLEELGDTSCEYLRARVPIERSRIEHIAAGDTFASCVIDDFHHLDSTTQRRLADLAKVSAESPEHRYKLILIGINQVGSGLIQLVPDIAKRIGIHRIQSGTREDTAQLVREGASKLGVVFADTDTIFNESGGDYWLTQQLCQTICTLNNILQSVPRETRLSFDLATLRRKVVERLSAAFYPVVQEFCRGGRFRPTNDPYFKLLQKISEQDSSVVDLNALANANPTVRGSINNIKEKRLDGLIRDKPLCAKHFYYNNATKNFAIEDPALFYFIRHLDWPTLRHDCGFRASVPDTEFNFAISFAGQNRDFARAIFNELSLLDARVFFDEHYEANYLGQTWSAQFERIFRHDSQWVICLLDEPYRERIWPTFERECFLPRVEKGEVFPIYLDDTVFVGIPRDLVGIKVSPPQMDISVRELTAKHIAHKLIERASQ
jgi:hypothetical protein